MRGPGHRGKLLIDSEPTIEKFEDALEAVKTILEGIQQFMTKEFEDPKSLVSQFLKSDDQIIDHSKTLNPDLINRIMDKLRKRKIASTYKMKATI